MKTITKYDDKTQEEIDDLKNQIFKIEMEYANRIDKARFTLERKRIENDYKTDLRIISLQNRICEIITYVVPKIIVLAENEEEKQKLERIVLNE